MQGRHGGSRTATAAGKLRQSSYAAVRAFLQRECADDKLTSADIPVLWGREARAFFQLLSRLSLWTDSTRDALNH